MQEDVFNNSGQAINSDFYCDPAVHRGETGDQPAVRGFLSDRA